MMLLAQELLRRSDWVILDTETTGLGYDDEIVQIGVLSPAGDVLLDTFVKPTKLIPAAATQIHGITDEMVAGAPGIAAVLPDLVGICSDKEVIIYNADYDIRMLLQSAAAAGQSHREVWFFDRWSCFMQAYAEYWGEWNDYHQSFTWQSLAKACRQQGIVVENAHSAIGDCRMVLALIRKLGLEIGE